MFRTLAVAGLLAALPGLAGAATIVANGSFEQDPGVLSQGGNGGSGGSGAGVNFADMPTTGANFGIWRGLPGWTTSMDGIEVQVARTMPLTPQDGNYYVEMDPQRNSTISQEVSLDAATYYLSFWYSPRTSEPSTNGVAYSIDGLVGSVMGPSAIYPQGTWTEVRQEFTIATAGMYTLRFDGIQASDSFGGFIDNVSIAPVPLPAGVLFLGTAVAGLGAMRRRKAANA